MGPILTLNKPTDSKMSCYQLTDKHHASIAAYVGEKMGFSWDKTVALADKLKRCNVQSVNYRYDQKKPARKCNMENRVKLDQRGFYDAIRCWAYQSCDNPGNLDYDILVAFLFSLVPDEFSTEMEIKQWGIY